MSWAAHPAGQEPTSSATPTSGGSAGEVDAMVLSAPAATGQPHAAPFQAIDAAGMPPGYTTHPMQQVFGLGVGDAWPLTFHQQQQQQQQQYDQQSLFNSPMMPFSAFQMPSPYQSQMRVPTFSDSPQSGSFSQSFLPPLAFQLQQVAYAPEQAALATMQSPVTSSVNGYHTSVSAGAAMVWNSPVGATGHLSAFSPGSSPHTLQLTAGSSPYISSESAVHPTNSFQQLMQQSVPLNTNAFQHAQLVAQQQSPQQYQSPSSSHAASSSFEPNRGRAASFPRNSTWASQMQGRSNAMTRAYPTSTMAPAGHQHAGPPPMMNRRPSFSSLTKFGASSTPVLLCTLIHSEYKENENDPQVQQQRVHTMMPFHSSVEYAAQQHQAAQAQAEPAIVTGSVEAVVRLPAGGGAYLRIPVPTLDELHELFSRHGVIHRLISFFKDGLCKALIEFESSAAAARAKAEFDGKEMKSSITRDNYGKMRIGFSQHTRLVVDDLQRTKGQGRDYELEQANQGGVALTHQLDGVLGPAHGSEYLASTVVHDADQSSNPVLRVSSLTKQTTCEHLRGLFSVYGQVKKIKFCYYQQDAALVEFFSPAHAKSALEHLHHAPLFNRRLEVEYSRHESVQLMASGSTTQSREYESNPSAIGIDQLEQQLGEDLTTLSSTLCFHGCPPHFTSLQLFKIISSQQANPPSRHSEATSGPAGVGQKRIFLQFIQVAAAVDVIAQFNGVSIASGAYVCKISFAGPPAQHQMAVPSAAHFPPLTHTTQMNGVGRRTNYQSVLA